MVVTLLIAMCDVLFSENLLSIFKGVIHCLRSRSSFKSAHDLFGAQENHEIYNKPIKYKL